MQKIVLEWLTKYIDDVTHVRVEDDKLVLLHNGREKAMIVYQRIR